MWIPFVAFWVLIVLARDELGTMRSTVAIIVWLGLLAGCMAAGISPLYFVVAQALLDVILVLIVFGGDIAIR